MALYLIKLSGSYAIESILVRAPSAAQAMVLAKVDVGNHCQPFNRLEIIPVDIDGDEGVLDTTSYIE